MSINQTPSKIPVGISSCLLGEAVRYDGDHSYDEVIDRYLSSHFHFHPICPEIAIGMGVPRDPIQLVKSDQKIRVQGIKDQSVDVTEKLHDFGIETARHLVVYGYIFKSRSPSCGMELVKTFTENGLPADPDGVGAFAKEIIKAIPDLPVTDENRLQNPKLRDEFIGHVFAYHASINNA